MTAGALTVIPVPGLPEIHEGDDLAALIAGATQLRGGDVLVVAQKVVSKVEGAVVQPRSGEPADEARRRVAREIAAEIVADAPWALIVRTHHGFVCANAGIDASNVPGGALTLLPADPDASARRLRTALHERLGVDVAVIVADTFGRPWRVGQTDVAIGVAGLRPLRSERGGTDREGNPLVVTEAAVADALASAADLVRGKAAGVPAVVIRGFAFEPADDASATELVRDAATDLFSRGAGMLAAALARPWPDAGLDPPAPHDLATIASVAVHDVVDPGPPALLRFTDAYDAGVAAGVAADLGLVVRRADGPGGATLEMGRPADRR